MARNVRRASTRRSEPNRRESGDTIVQGGTMAAAAGPHGGERSEPRAPKERSKLKGRRALARQGEPARPQMDRRGKDYVAAPNVEDVRATRAGEPGGPSRRATPAPPVNAPTATWRAARHGERSPRRRSDHLGFPPCAPMRRRSGGGASLMPPPAAAPAAPGGAAGAAAGAPARPAGTPRAHADIRGGNMLRW